MLSIHERKSEGVSAFEKRIKKTGYSVYEFLKTRFDQEYDVGFYNDLDRYIREGGDVFIDGSSGNILHLIFRALLSNSDIRLPCYSRMLDIAMASETYDEGKEVKNLRRPGIRMARHCA